MAQTAVCRFHQLQNKARCPESCEIEDAFPEYPGAGVADQYTRVHAIYGGTNLLSYFRSLPEEVRLVRGRSLLMIADLWDRNPEGGPKACFKELKVQIEKLKAEGFRSVNGPTSFEYKNLFVPPPLPIGVVPSTRNKNDDEKCMFHSHRETRCPVGCPLRAVFPGGSSKEVFDKVYARFGGSSIPKFFRGRGAVRKETASAVGWEGDLWEKKKDGGGPLAAFLELERELAVLNFLKEEATRKAKAASKSKSSSSKSRGFKVVIRKTLVKSIGRSAAAIGKLAGGVLGKKMVCSIGAGSFGFVGKTVGAAVGKTIGGVVGNSIEDALERLSGASSSDSCQTPSAADAVEAESESSAADAVEAESESSSAEAESFGAVGAGAV